jgi:membrane protease YdiL (CAAX protease family)
VFWSAEKSLVNYKNIVKLMGRVNPFFILLVLVFFVLLGSEALVRLGLKTQFYIWEFEIDLKPAVFGVLCYFFNRKFQIGFKFAKIGVRSWDWPTNFLAFFSPFGLFALLIVVGVLFKATAYQGVENSTTFLLATFFDIPATFFFSITTVLLEEIVFRGFVFSTISKGENFVLPALLTSGLWALMSFSNAFQIQNSSFGSILIEFLNLISIGFVCSALLLFSKSIWSSYSFRIGLMVFSTALLCGKLDETNSFYITNLASFSSNGILLSLLNFIFATILFKLHKKRHKSAFLQ